MATATSVYVYHGTVLILVLTHFYITIFSFLLIYFIQKLQGSMGVQYSI